MFPYLRHVRNIYIYIYFIFIYFFWGGRASEDEQLGGEESGRRAGVCVHMHQHKCAKRKRRGPLVVVDSHYSGTNPEAPEENTPLLTPPSPPPPTPASTPASIRKWHSQLGFTLGKEQRGCDIISNDKQRELNKTPKSIEIVCFDDISLPRRAAASQGFLFATVLQHWNRECVQPSESTVTLLHAGLRFYDALLNINGLI